MNLSTAIFLMDDAGARAVRVEYDPDVPKNNNPHKVFKTVDQSIAKDDMVVVQTSTRHGFTVAKVVEVDLRIDLESSDTVLWVVTKLNKDAIEQLLAQEQEFLDVVADVELQRKKAQLRAAMDLDKVSLTGMDFLRGTAITAGPQSAAEPVAEAPPPSPDA